MPSTPTPPDRYDAEASPLLVQRARDYIEAASWRFASTMAGIPHWYVMRARAHPAGLGGGHEALYLLIKQHGYERRFYSKTFRTIDLDGWKVWMITNGDFLNTAPLGEPFEPVPFCHVHEDPMRLDDGRPYRYWHCARCDRTAR